MRLQARQGKKALIVSVAHNTQISHDVTMSCLSMHILATVYPSLDAWVKRFLSGNLRMVDGATSVSIRSHTSPATLFEQRAMVLADIVRTGRFSHS